MPDFAFALGVGAAVGGWLALCAIGFWLLRHEYPER